MVSVVKRKEYYFLKHSNKERYLGKTIPKNILELKREFLISLLRDKWIKPLGIIKKGYSNQLRHMPKNEIVNKMVEFSYFYTHDTNKIEGSSLTKKETYNLLRFHLTPVMKPESDLVEAKKHHETFLQMINSSSELSLKNVLHWHTKIFEQTKPYHAGKIRKDRLIVIGSRSTFPYPKFVPLLLKEFFNWYNKSKGKVDPVELAGLAHFRFVSIHPFGDGNGRISRLIMNNVLYRYGYPLSNIKYAERFMYYRALEKAQTENEEIHFLKWFMKRYLSEHFKHYSK